MNVMFHRFYCCIILILLPVAAHASLQEAINALLDQADADLAADRLTTPINGNAFDRYQAALLLDKGNQRAQLGLRAIADRYLAFARSQTQQGRYGQAQASIAKAIKVNGRNAATQQALNAISQARRQVTKSTQPKPAQALVAKKLNPVQTTFTLNATQLSQRDQAIKNQLFSLGKRIQSSGEYALIYARTDAEGRWIYQQLREASVGYRVRGNIKRSKKPRVVLESPIE